MGVMISMLRGVNVGGHNMIKMEALRALFVSLKLRDAQTFIQSGNVIFRTDERDVAALTKRVQSGIERSFGCCPDVIFRTLAEMRDTVARNPFAKRRDIEPSKFLVTFLSSEPAAAARAAALKMMAGPDELRIHGRELYIYYASGLARPTVPWMSVVKTLKTTGTGRNWNSVTKMLEIAEKLEASE